VQAGAGRQLGHADQVLLVRRRHEAARDAREHQAGAGQQDGVDDDGQGLALQDAGDAAAVVGRAPLEEAVEPVEEAAEDGVHGLHQPVLGRVMRA
ncbi:hypothetical protein FD65_15105, partial [Staphylococcus aureus]